MRLFPATASRALIVVLAALFAGCSSTSQGTQALPGGVSSQSVARAPGAFPQFLPKGPVSSMELLKLQAQGKLAGPIPDKMLLKQIKMLQAHSRPHFSFRRGKSATVAGWVSISEYDYLIGVNTKLDKALTDIDTESNGCYDPITVKVDSSQNIWSACEDNSTFSAGAVQEYSSTGGLTATYNQGCAGNITGCEDWFSYGFDSASNSSDVFSALDFYEYEVCNPSCVFEEGAGFEYWPVGEPSATPTLVSLGADCSPVCDVYYFDLDSSGNIWFDYYGYNSSTGTYGYGLAEVTSPKTTPTVVGILAPGAMTFPGGVYVSGGGSVLNVTDQGTRETNQYDLPLSPSGSPFNTLGPTKENDFNCGDPVSGGFNQAESKMAFGDACSWVDKGTVATNKWRAEANINFTGAEGAAYTPSDK